VWCETKGAGDDILIELEGGAPVVELQAKSGDALNGPASLKAALAKSVSKLSPQSQLEIVYAVDEGAAKSVRRDFARDLTRLRSGRSDELKPITRTMVSEVTAVETLLPRLRVIQLDVDTVSSGDAKTALDALRHVLTDPDQAETVLELLIADAATVCKRRLRRDRAYLEKLLAGRRIKVEPIGRDQRWHASIDLAKKLSESYRTPASLAVLEHIETELGNAECDPRVRHRLFNNKAALLKRLGRIERCEAALHLALEYKPDDAATLTSLALTAMGRGETQNAMDYVGRALMFEPDRPDSWGVRAQIRATLGLGVEEPPANVANDKAYQTHLANIAANDGRWSDVEKLTGLLLKANVRTPELLTLRAIGALNEIITVRLTEERRALICSEVERLTTEAIDLLEDDGPTKIAVLALATRARARRLVGEEKDADADVSRANALDPDDPNVIRQRASALLDLGEYEQVVKSLTDAVVEADPFLFIPRARARFETNDRTGGQADLLAALRALRDDDEAAYARLAIVELAIELEDLAFAETVISSINPNQARVELLVFRARIAKGRGDLAAMGAAFEEAAEASADPARNAALVEYGMALGAAKEWVRAGEVFERAGGGAPGFAHQEAYGRALFNANDLQKAAALVDRLTKSGALPDWALELGSLIAYRQGDWTSEANYLQELTQRGSRSVYVRLRLASALSKSNRASESAVILDDLVKSEGLSPLEQMQVAQLYEKTPSPSKAMPLAFLAWRRLPTDMQLSGAFVNLFLTHDHNDIPQPSEVGSDTHVTLSSPETEPLEYVIYDSGPIDSRANEYLRTDPVVADLLGLRTGDRIIRNKGQWNAIEYTVAEIKPAIAHAAFDVAKHFSSRFPGQGFIQEYKVGDGDSLRLLAPVIAGLHGRKQRLEELCSLYDRQLLPIGMLAGALGANQIGVMQLLTSSPSRRLQIEWSHVTGVNESHAAAMAATTFVVTRSALATLENTGLTERVFSAYDVICARTTFQEVCEEEERLAKLVDKGESTFVEEEDRIRLRVIAPGEATPSLERLTSLRERLEKNARIEVRPLSSFEVVAGTTDRGMTSDELRDALGEASFDTLAIAKDQGVPCYADDLGLRSVAATEFGVRSFSTVGLILALASKGIISSSERDLYLLRLIELRCHFVPVNAELLHTATKHAGTLGRETVDAAFARLADPGVELITALAIAGQLLRRVALADVAVASLREITITVLRALVKDRSPMVVARLLTRVAEDVFLLMPSAADEVRDACNDFLRLDGGVPRLGSDVPGRDDSR